MVILGRAAIVTALHNHVDIEWSRTRQKNPCHLCLDFCDDLFLA
jgi:hypothetical protein